MRETTYTKSRTETATLLAATITCYLVGFACVLALSYSLAALAATGLKGRGVDHRETEARLVES